MTYSMIIQPPGNKNFDCNKPPCNGPAAVNNKHCQHCNTQEVNIDSTIGIGVLFILGFALAVWYLRRNIKI